MNLTTRQVVIHSRKIAQLIIDAGQPVVRIEPNRNQHGKLVFIFDQTELVADVLNRNRRPHPI